MFTFVFTLRVKKWFRLTSLPVAMLLRLIMVLLGSVGMSYGYAEENPLFDLYSISAAASGEVTNDLLTATLVVEHEDRDSAALANRVNADMSWALEQIHQFPAVDSRSGNYSTWPQYERKQNKIIGWRSQQQLTIESDDFSIARKAIKLLQERLQVRSMQVRPKSETRQSREDDLIAEALTAFRQRASLVQSTMGATDFRIVRVDINTNSHGGRPYIQQRGASVSSFKVENEPAIEAGTSEVTVTINGQIQLQ